MKQLNINCIKRWVAKGSSKLSQPASIGICCPACSMRGVFSTKRRHYDEHRDTFACSADCPACNSQVHFWLHDLIGDSDAEEDHQPTLYMSPASTTQLDLSALPDSVPENVLEFCRSTQDVHQTGNLTATCVLAHSTLDALFTEFLPHGNSQTTLSKLVADALRSMDLEQPLTNLSSSLHPDGHLQQLLQNRQHASPESVEALLRLIENLITYLFVMPEKFAELDQQFKELNQLTADAKQAFEAQTSANTAKAGGLAGSDAHEQQRGAA